MKQNELTHLPTLSTQGMIYICTLAEKLNFHEAAKACHTSQPNLSTQLKNIENELGIMIFERSKRGVFPTKNGQNVIESFKRILDEINTLHDYSDTLGNNTITIGIFPTLAPYLLPCLMKVLKETLPEIKLIITEDKTEQITEKLLSGKLDCVLAAYPIYESKLDHEILFTDPFLVAVSSDHPFSKKKNVTLAELKNERILLLAEGHCLRDQALDVCHSDLLPIDPSYEASSLETLRAMVAGNAGITFIPQICVDKNPMLAYIPLATPFSRKIALFWRQSSHKKNSLSALCKVIKDCHAHTEIETK